MDSQHSAGDHERGASSPPLRVLHVIDSLGHGGAEHQLALTVRSFDPSRVHSLICHLNPDVALVEDIRRAGTEVRGIGRGRTRDLLLASRRLLSIAQRYRPDLIHTSLFQSDIAGGLVGRYLGVPVVGTLCSQWGQEQSSNNVRGPVKLAVASGVWGASLRNLHSHSIAISAAVRENAVAAFGLSPERVSIIYRALDDSDSVVHPIPALREELGLAPTDFVFFNVGRLVPGKGQLHLIRAMQVVVAALPSAKLLIAGEGWYRRELEAEIQALGLGDRVRLLGARNDVPALMRMSDVFVFPSLSEGLGVSLVEAAGLGCSCITTNIPPMTEVIDDDESGLCVPPGDVAALASAMLALGRDPERAGALAREAARRAAQRFDRTTIVQSIERVYRSVLGGSSALRGPRAGLP